jgi:hypothetical protein
MYVFVLGLWGAKSCNYGIAFRLPVITSYLHRMHEMNTNRIGCSENIALDIYLVGTRFESVSMYCFCWGFHGFPQPSQTNARIISRFGHRRVLSDFSNSSFIINRRYIVSNPKASLNSLRKELNAYYAGRVCLSTCFNSIVYGRTFMKHCFEEC